MGQNGPDKETIERGIDQAYAENGFADPDGGRDLQKMRDRLYEIVSKAVVDKKGERARKAITIGRVVEEVFPNLPSDAEGWENTSDPELAEKVHAGVRQKISTDLKMDYTGYIQTRIGNGSNGQQVLCRTKIKPDGNEAVYITDDLGCIRADFTEPMADKGRRQAERYGRNAAMVTERHPEYGNKLLREYRSAQKLALDAGEGRIQLALEVANENGAATETEAATA